MLNPSTSKSQLGELRHLTSQKKRKQKMIPIYSSDERNENSLNHENGVVRE